MICIQLFANFPVLLHFSRSFLVSSFPAYYTFSGPVWHPLKPDIPQPSSHRPYPGYDLKVLLRTGTGNRICSNSIPVLVTGTGIFFLKFQFRSIRHRNFESMFNFWLNRNQKMNFNGFPDEIYRNYLSKNHLFKKCLLR